MSGRPVPGPRPPGKKLRVGVLGATGVAGHQALTALAGHPWFELVMVAGSAGHHGRRLRERLAEQGEAGMDVLQRLPAAVADLRLHDAVSVEVEGLDLLFSMLPSQVARGVETRCAAAVPVISTASAYRDEHDTPVLLAGVNPGHFALLGDQARGRGWQGFVAPGPNCTTVGLAVTLAPLVAAFGVTAVTLTSMQAVSGAGSRAPEVLAAAERNVLPWIADEEEKVERETLKILGAARRGEIEPAAFPVSATCTRVPVAHGHTLSVSVGLDRNVSPADVAAVWDAADPFAGRNLPSAPRRWIELRAERDRPQPKLDRDTGKGFTTVVGRLRRDPVTGGVKYMVVSHNAVLGAAGGAVLLAEDLLDRGLLGDAPRPGAARTSPAEDGGRRLG